MSVSTKRHVKADRCSTDCACNAVFAARQALYARRVFARTKCKDKVALWAQALTAPARRSFVLRRLLTLRARCVRKLRLRARGLRHLLCNTSLSDALVPRGCPAAGAH